MTDDERDPFAELGDEAGSAPDADDERDPFAELGDEAGSAPDADDSAFDAVDVDPVEVEEVWASLADDGEQPEVSLGDDAEPLDDADHRVPKRQYCQRCPFFADPPAVGCTHEGTSIVAVEDAEHFRVRNCPMVEGSPPGGER